MGQYTQKMEIDSTEIICENIKITFEDGLKILTELKKDLEPMHRIIKVTVKPTEQKRYEIEYDVEPPKFERIRRVTGYLTGTLDRWNDSKRAEERERVKHGI